MPTALETGFGRSGRQFLLKPVFIALALPPRNEQGQDICMALNFHVLIGSGFGGVR